MEIIAEIGQNHNGEMGLALELINKAKESGADVAKFQLYDARTLFSKENNEWFEYNCKTEISREQLSILADECKKINIEFMASVFDVERVGWTEEIGVRRYKIASRSINDKNLLRKISSLGKPIIASLGMWKQKAFPVIEGAKELDFMYCISKYPAPLEDVKLAMVNFEQYSGYSDHTIGITAAMAAFARGAKIVEKHFTLDKNMYGPDHFCSMTPGELKAIHQYRKELTQCI